MSNHNRMSFHEYARFSPPDNMLLSVNPARLRLRFYLSLFGDVCKRLKLFASRSAQTKRIDLPEAPPLTSTTARFLSLEHHYLDILALDDSVFKVDATGGLRPRLCVVTDSLPERVGGSRSAV
jgi:hypothetical protein